MSGKMIMFDSGSERFQLRAVGVAYKDNKVLIHRAEKDDFWSLPGGRIEMLESSEDTLVREMKEELGIDIEVERLLWVSENFFEYENKVFHELGFYYQMKLPENCPLFEHKGEFTGDEQEIKLIFKWQPIDRLDDLVLYPTFLKRTLTTKSEGIEHIIETEP